MNDITGGHELVTTEPVMNISDDNVAAEIKKAVNALISMMNFGASRGIKTTFSLASGNPGTPDENVYKLNVLSISKTLI